jgi:hypothetical protein
MAYSLLSQAVDIFPLPSLEDEFDCTAPFGELRKHLPVVFPHSRFEPYCRYRQVKQCFSYIFEIMTLIILTPSTMQSFVTSRDLTKFATEDEEQLQYALLSYRTPSTISSVPLQRKFE